MQDDDNDDFIAKARGENKNRSSQQALCEKKPDNCGWPIIGQQSGLHVDTDTELGFPQEVIQWCIWMILNI